MKSKKRICIVCGQEYEYCNRCGADAHYPAWKSIYHDENCREIMRIATEYMANNISKSEAKKKLNSCNLENKTNFENSVSKAVNQILATKKNNGSKNVFQTEVVEPNVENVE